MTLNEITTLIASHLGKELDMPFKLILAEKVNYWRARLLKDTLKGDIRSRRYNIQTLWVYPKTEGEIPECFNKEGLECKLYVTTELPKPLRANNILFDYVGTADGMTPYQETQSAYIPYLAHNKYSCNIVKYVYEQNRLKFYNKNDNLAVKVQGIFERPLDVFKYNCGEGDCDIWNEEYPIKADSLQLVVQSILQVEYNRMPPVLQDSAEIEITNPIVHEPVQQQQQQQQ